jgi:hypothetical protein
MLFAQIAVVESARGPMIQEGGFNTCLDLAAEGMAEKTKLRATHAVAKVRAFTCSLAYDRA